MGVVEVRPITVTFMSHLPERYWRCPTRAAIAALTERFGLPFDPSMQDWTVEVADATRLPEFLAALNDGSLTDDERFTLGEIVTQCFEDTADLGKPLFGDEEWDRFVAVLLAEPDLHAHTACYWAEMTAASEVPGGCLVADHMRPIWREVERRIGTGGGAK